MPNWKKVIVSGSNAELNQITGSVINLSNLPAQASEATSLMIGTSGNVGTRELGTNAFNSTAFTTCTGTVTGTGTDNQVMTSTGFTGIQGEANLTFDGSTLKVTGGITGSTTLTIGSSQTNTGTFSSILGGSTNTNDGTTSTIGGGVNNIIGNQAGNSFIAAGSGNEIYQLVGCTFIGVGLQNCVTSPYAFIGTGQQNKIAGSFTSVVGGRYNTGSAFWGFIGGGENNFINGTSAISSSIIGGSNNTTTFGNTHIIGSSITADKANYTFVNNLQADTNLSSSTLTLSGLANQASETTAVMINGSNVVGTRELGSNAFNSTAFTTCTGTVTGVTSGNTNTITIGGTTDAPTVAVCIGTITGDNQNLATGDQIYTFVTGQGYTTCTGDITGVTAGNGLTGGATSGNATLNIGAGTGIDVSADAIAVDVSDFMSNGVNNRIITATGSDAMNAEANLTFDGTTLTVGSKATIGTNHSNTGTLSTITGGTLNTASADCSFIGGGYSNYVGQKSTRSVIVGGTNNTASNSSYYGNDNFIGAGCNNSISSYCDGCNFIGGGCGNTISGYGNNNLIVGGKNNSNSGYCSGILGGKNNTISTCNYAFIIGSDITATANCYTFMNNACISGTTRTTTLVETSAKKHKECILPLQDQIENIQKLEPVNFQWKENGKKDIGFIAEQVKEVYPNLVSYEEDGEIHGVQYSKLTTVLVKALQQQQEQIEELKKEIFIIKNNLNG